MKLHRDQAGFSAVEALLGLILIAIIVFIGYYVYHTQSDKTTAPTASVSTSKSSVKSNSVKYLTISQWGVKLPLTSDIDGATYSVSAGNSDGAQTASLTVPDGCDSMFTLFRGSATDINPATEALGGGGGTEFQSSGKKVGNYYYSDAIGNASSCFSGEQMVAGTANGVKTEAVYSQFKTAFDYMSATDTN